MKIGIVITTYGSVESAAYRNHLSVLLDWKSKLDIDVYHVPDTQQEAALNALTKAAITDKCDYVFYMEHDNIYNKDTLPMLLKHELDVATGYYTFRNWPYAPIPLKKDKENGLLYRLEFVRGGKEENLMEMTVGCFGCCLVKVPVLKHLFNKGLKFRREYDKKSSSTLTTDCVFFMDVIKEGYKCMVDGNVRIGHLGDRIVITPDNYLIYRELIRILVPEFVPLNERLTPEELKKKLELLIEVNNAEPIKSVQRNK